MKPEKTRYKKSWIMVDLQGMKKAVALMALDKDISSNELIRRGVRDYMKKEQRRIRNRKPAAASGAGDTA